MAGVDDPLFAAVTANPGRDGAVFMSRLVGAGALIAIRAPSFRWPSPAPGSSITWRRAGFLPAVFGRVNGRQAPAPAVYLVAAIALVTAVFPPNSAMVVFIFLISVSHALLLAAFLRLRRREPELARTYRAAGGAPIALMALVLSIAVMVSCYRLEVRALQIAIAAIAVLVAQFSWLRPGARANLTAPRKDT